MDAYQVMRVRSYPGAAGMVMNNLAALRVGRIVPVTVIGEDGEGYEFRQALQAQRVVDLRHLDLDAGRRTPTYTKPMLQTDSRPARECRPPPWNADGSTPCAARTQQRRRSCNDRDV
jgi:hypothetical protein